MKTEELRNQVISQIDLNEECSDEKLHDLIDGIIGEKMNDKYMPLEKRWTIHKEIFDSIRGLGVLQELLDDQEISEIMVNDKDNIFIEKRGIIEKFKGSFISEERLEDVIQHIVGRANRRVNQSSPIVDARLIDGSRVNVVLSPISIHGSTITIRKFPKDAITMDKLIEMDSISSEAANFLKDMVVAGYNIFISGGTGSGKTTFLNALSNYIPEDQRVITIEDSAELQLQNVTNIVSLEVRQENIEGDNAITVRELIKASLRMRPDRIIVGEVRGAEALDMLQAMNTGHDGSMSTGHANSSKDMISRLETMVLTGAELPISAIRSQIASGVDLIVHLGRLRDKSRKVISIDEVMGIKNGEVQLKVLFLRKEVEGRTVLEKISRISNQEKLQMAGISKYE